MEEVAISIVVPMQKHEVATMACRQDFMDSGADMHIPGSGEIQDFTNFKEWLLHCQSNNNINQPAGRVRSTQYLVMDEGKKHVVGFIQLRHSLTQYLYQSGGHIGYSIAPRARKKGYATKALRLCLKKAKLLGIDKVLITCDIDNLGSESVIKKVGGKLENITPSEGLTKSKKRYWVKTI